MADNPTPIPPSVPPFAAADNQVLAPAWFFILFLATLLGLGYVLEPFTADVVAAFILVALFQGTYERMSKVLPGHRWIASAVTSLFIVVVVAIPVIIIGYYLVMELITTLQASREALATPLSTTDLFRRVQATLAPFGVSLNDQQLSLLTTRIQGVLSDTAIDQATQLLSNGIALIIHFTIVIVMVFYLLVDGTRLKRFVFDLSPLPVEEEELLVKRFVEVSRGILLGNGIGSVFQGALGAVAFWVVGLPAPVVWGTAMALFAFLPIVGISLVVIPAAVYLLLLGKVTAAIIFFTFCMAQALFFENVVKTRLIGSQTRMHDRLVFLSVIGGLAGFGVFGLVYGPLIAVSFLTLVELYRRTYRHAVVERIRLRGSYHDGSFHDGAFPEG